MPSKQIKTTTSPTMDLVTSSLADQTHCRLLELPPELRLKIYEYLLVPDKQILIKSYGTKAAIKGAGGIGSAARYVACCPTSSFKRRPRPGPQSQSQSRPQPQPQVLRLCSFIYHEAQPTLYQFGSVELQLGYKYFKGGYKKPFPIKELVHCKQLKQFSLALAVNVDNKTSRTNDIAHHQLLVDQLPNQLLVHQLNVQILVLGDAAAHIPEEPLEMLLQDSVTRTVGGLAAVLRPLSCDVWVDGKDRRRWTKTDVEALWESIGDGRALNDLGRHDVNDERLVNCVKELVVFGDSKATREHARKAERHVLDFIG